MEFIHCNICGFIPGPGNNSKRFVLTNCLHIMCQNCLGNCKDSIVCKVCKNNCRVVEINGQLKPEVRLFFMDSSTVIKECLKKAATIFDFQKFQQRKFQFFASQFGESMRKYATEYEIVNAKLKCSTQQNQELQKKVDELTLHIQSMSANGNGASGFEMGFGTTSFFDNNNKGLDFQTPSSVRGSFGVQNPDPGLFSPIERNGNHAVRRQKTPGSTGSGGDNIAKITKGRLTRNLTPTDDEVPARERFSSPNFSAAPGAERRSNNSTYVSQTPQYLRHEESRASNFHSQFGYETPMQQNQAQGRGTDTPDILSRLRQLRCTAETPR